MSKRKAQNTFEVTVCYCGKTFEEPGVMAEHFLREHVNVGAVNYPLPVNCIYCESKCESATELGAHHVNVHILGLHGKPQFFCPRCEAYVQGDNISVHLNDVHPFRCLLCLHDQVHSDNHDICMKVVLDALQTHL